MELWLWNDFLEAVSMRVPPGQGYEVRWSNHATLKAAVVYSKKTGGTSYYVICKGSVMHSIH